MKSQATILFLRVPEKGRVKTRLSKSLDKDFVLELYKAFVQDMLATLSENDQTFLFFSPPDKKDLLVEWLGEKYVFHGQQGDDLGQKMAHAFETVFYKGFDRAILLGTDIPEINEKSIFDAGDALEKTGVVVGPSSDGGYYLIGLNRAIFRRSLFDGIKWSTQGVLDQTLKIFQERAIDYEMIETLDDIDTLQDFNALKKRVVQGQKIGEHTLKVLTAHGL